MCCLAQNESLVSKGDEGGARADSLLQLFAMALALPALIMITACVNVAGLLLSRAFSRQREMAVRLALGTSKTALVRMLLIESVLVSGLAAVVSLSDFPSRRVGR
jgi:ABC-type antimicrobial peptide transport system permease subunit